MSDYVLGLALAGAAEFTALSVVEYSDAAPPVYSLRHLQCFDIGTPYATIIDTVAAMVGTKTLWHAPIIVDFTVVGHPLINMLREATDNNVVPVAITAGLTLNRVEGNYHVPKKELVTCMQLLLQNRRLKVPRALPEADRLVTELQNFRIKLPATNDLLADWRDGPHDDLVFAVVLACWWAERNPREAPLEMPVCTVPQRFRHMIGGPHERLCHRP